MKSAASSQRKISFVIFKCSSFHTILSHHLGSRPSPQKGTFLNLPHFAGDIFSILTRLLPRRLRFKAAILTARAAAPLLRSTGIVQERLALRMETLHEIVTYQVLEALTRHGVEFDPILRCVGLEHFDAGLIRGRGLLLVSLHAMLSTYTLRCLLGKGISATVVSPAPMTIQGTTVPVQVLAPGPAFLLDVRRILRDNGVVGAMLDRDEHSGNATFEVSTAQGPVIVADALIRLAVRSGAAVVFVAGRLAGGEIVVEHSVPSDDELRTAEGVTSAFVAFLKDHVADVGVD
jgi:lauroyl/myristoyl acyltransferase